MLSHDVARLIWTEETLADIGIIEYRFCVENDCYVCDKQGNFYSVCTRQFSKAGNLVEKYTIRKLNGSIDRYGYITYRISVNGVKKHLKAHRMMLNAWIGEQSNLSVNHKDGNKQNNSLSNLEWCTVAENNAHAIKTGLSNPHCLKSSLYAVSTCDWMTIFILNKHMGYSFCELARMYRCSHTTISKMIYRIEKSLTGVLYE